MTESGGERLFGFLSKRTILGWQCEVLFGTGSVGDRDRRASRGERNDYPGADNGAGFKTQYAERLFGVLRRVHSAEEFEGRGIWLGNIRRIISTHGGRPAAEGEVYKGRSFTFSIPKGRGKQEMRTNHMGDPNHGDRGISPRHVNDSGVNGSSPLLGRRSYLFGVR